MDNVLETQGVPLTVFGGAIPEMAPEDIPEGGCPWNQDVDFSPGSVFTRGGRQNQVTFGNLAVTHTPHLGRSLPGAYAPTEAAWGTPQNISTSTPGTYASVSLNTSPIGGGYVDGTTHGSGTVAVPATPFTFPSITLNINSANTTAFFAFCCMPPAGGGTLFNPQIPAGFSNFASVGSNTVIAYKNIAASGPLTVAETFNGGTSASENYVQTLTAFGGTIAYVQLGGFGNNSGASGVLTSMVGTAAGNSLLVWVTVPFAYSGNITNQACGMTLSDSQGNTWYLLDHIFNTDVEILVFLAPNIPGGNVTVNWANYNPGLAGPSFEFHADEWTIVPIPAGVPHSQVLAASTYIPATIPNTATVLGMQVVLGGHQSTLAAGVNLTVTTNRNDSPIMTTQLPISDGAVIVGTSTSQWGTTLTPAMLNDPNFGINVVANSPTALASFSIYGVQLRIFITPSPPANFNWVKTYEQTDGEIDTLALDANGVLWDEDVDTNPTVLNSIFTTLLPNTYAKGVTFQDIEYIALSNLQNGTDVPRQWNGTNLDRISMVGPGAAPTAASSGGAGSNTTAIQTITQGAPVMLRRIAWGASTNAINDSTPGTTLVVYGEGKTGANTYQSLPPYTPSYGPGTTVVLSGIPVPFPLKWGATINANLNQTYTINQVTTATVGGSEQVPVFTVPAPFSAYGYSSDFGSAGPPPTSNWFYQSAIATMTMQAPLANIGVGSTISIAGTGGGPPAGYDGNFTVLSAPNTVQMTINSCQLTGNIATYSYTLVPPSPAPAFGQIVSIQNCIPPIFNTAGPGVAITAVSGGSPGGTFSINLSGPDTSPPAPISQAGNNATATVAGTVFTFDATKIVGNKSGGTVVQQGQIIQGARKVCYCFLTRSGYLTQPSPIFNANITASAGAITVTGLATGPPNVIARVVCFTGAGGGNFFYIAQPVSVTVAGVTTKNDSTIVQDNTSTSATFSFSDNVLLNGIAIDIPGNNAFNTIELGSCRGLLTYASRVFAWSEQMKITNLRNWSFDGGFSGAVIQGANVTQPLGWSLDATQGGGGSLVQSSPVFGWSYQISNTSGMTQTTYGMLTQNAYQDEFGVAIVQASTLYSVRITASVIPVPGSGNLVVDLFSPKLGVSLGTFSVPLASMTTGMQIYSGTLLTSILQPVPNDLIIRLWAQNITNGTTIAIDRVEPFPTLGPVLSTAFKGSYVNNQEAFDLVTGVCGPAQNMQPINGGMVLFDLLYALKERSWYSTSDNGVTEPNKWNWKEVSAKTGTIGINSYDWGEGWALTGNREGIFFFEGGEPLKVSQEIQPLWDLINWTYGYTLWVRNDPEQRRFTVGIPIATPNPYMPEFPVNNNPTSPNVVLMCNYRELNSGAAIAQTGPIRSTFSGRLMSPEPARKWSFWNLQCPYSDYISRANNNWPQWFCSGYADSKIYALQASQLSDDGAAINSFWISYGFVKPEMADAKGLGLFRMEMPYITILATGSGNLNTYVYPESPLNPAFALDPLPLPTVSQGDLELGVNVKGQRFFIRVGTNAVGSAFRVSKLVVPLIADTWSPIRGYNNVTA